MYVTGKIMVFNDERLYVERHSSLLLFGWCRVGTHIEIIFGFESPWKLSALSLASYARRHIGCYGNYQSDVLARDPAFSGMRGSRYRFVYTHHFAPEYRYRLSIIRVGMLHLVLITAYALARNEERKSAARRRDGKTLHTVPDTNYIL